MDHALELDIVIGSAVETPLSAGRAGGRFYPVSARLTRPPQPGARPSPPEALSARGQLPAADLEAAILAWENSLSQADPVVRAAQDAATGRALSDLLFQDELDHLFATARQDLLATPGELLRVRLEVKPSEVQRAAWELLLLRFGERGVPAGGVSNRLDFVRYSPVPPRPLDVPFSLPIDALMVTPGAWFDCDPEHEFDLRAMLEADFPHLRYRLPVDGLDARRVQINALPEFLQALDRESVDILHLVLPAERDARGRGVLCVGPDPAVDRVSAGLLDGTLHDVGTRLLVLHDPTPDGSAAPALWQVAGQIMRAGGPPTLVVRFPHAPHAVYGFFQVFYQDVIHGQGLGVSYYRTILEGLHGPGARSWPAFFAREGSEEALHLSLLLERLVDEAGTQESAVTELEQTWTDLQEQLEAVKGPEAAGGTEPEAGMPPDVTTRGEPLEGWPPEGGPSEGLVEKEPRMERRPVAEALTEIGGYAGRVRRLNLDYEHESRGLLPLADVWREMPRARAAMAEAEAAVEELREEVEAETAHREVRYLNTHFSRSRPEPENTGDDPVPPGSRLGRGRTYYVAVDIRSDRSGSHVVDEVEWPDQQLPDRELAEAQGGRSLRVALFSQDFTLVEDQKPLWLPLYGPGERLYFQVVAPDRLGLAQIRLCVYYKNNLVQSRMVYAHVGRGKRTDAGRGNWSEVEVTLSATFGDLDRLQPRGLNIVFNEDRTGTHALFVRGDGLKDNVFDLRDEMSEALKGFRGALNKIMFEEGAERYRLDRRSGEPNWGTDETITTDLRRLAHVGSKWYRDLFGEEKQELQGALRQRLEDPTTIQIVRAKGKHIFPWAVLYDMPLVRTKTNKVCLEFRRHVTSDSTLDYAACRAACPYLDRTHNPPKHDTDVVCVFGFWGIKHVVEQPLSASIKLNEGGGERERRPSSVHSVIEYEGKPVLHVGISLKLDFVGPHVKTLQDWIGREGAFQPFQPDRTLQAIGQGLSSTPLHVYYFYCHGGQSESDEEVWLSVGDDEYIMPDHIRFAWELRNKWEEGQPPFVPLVFLNGCGTLSLSPESVADFLHEFTVAGAAGVIGTEISVDERLAQEVGLHFLKAFARRGQAARIIQEVRHRLLLKNNPLGLVYTPYCYAELHLEPTG